MAGNDTGLMSNSWKLDTNCVRSMLKKFRLFPSTFTPSTKMSKQKKYTFHWPAMYNISVPEI